MLKQRRNKRAEPKPPPGATYSGNSRTLINKVDFNCMDCQTNTSEIHEYYMLNDDVWFSVVPSRQGMLCIKCMEKRLGRQLTPFDFNNSYVNRRSFGKRSLLLTERLGFSERVAA